MQNASERPEINRTPMNLCNEGHEEVCFEGRKCPACSAMEQLQDMVDSLNDDVSKLEKMIIDLENELEVLK